MATIKSQAASELKLLPLTLGKLTGAFIAVISFAWAVIKNTRRPEIDFSAALPLIVSGVLGVLVFILFDRAIKSRQKHHSCPPAAAARKTVPPSLVSWALLLALAAVFVLATLVVTR